ncbi:MAG: glycosyltransferase family 39 protein [bacterium]|nr:glycosyltransferase family 39 protein [bacterium]
MGNLKFLDCYRTDQSIRYVFYTFLAISFLLRMFYANKLSLATDESYYWTWSENLSLGYYDSGAILGWVIRFFTNIFGYHEVAVRTGSLILMTGTSLILYRLAKKFISPILAVCAVILFNITPGGGLVGVLMMHDSFMIFFWSLTTLLLYKAIFENKKSLWYFSGISAGLGLWSKDIMVLGYISAFLFLLLSQKHRFWLKRKEPYLAFLLSILVFSPIIYWNFTHNFVTYRHIFALGTRPMGLDQFKRMGDFLGSQLGLVSPFIFLGILAAWINILIKWFKTYDSQKLFLLLFSFFIFLFFFLLSAKSKVEGNWSGFAYLLGIVCYFYILEDIWRLRTTNKLKYLGYTLFSAIFSFLLVLIMFNPIILYKLAYNMPGVSANIIEEVRGNRTNDINGWREFGKKIYNFRDNYLKNYLDTDFFFFTLRYQVATELWFYYPQVPKKRVYCLPIARRMNQLDIWWGLDVLAGQNGVFVAEHKETKRIMPYFDSVELVHSFTVHRDDLKDEAIRTYYLYLCRNFKGMERKDYFESY